MVAFALHCKYPIQIDMPCHIVSYLSLSVVNELDFFFSYFRFVSHLHTGAEVSLSVIKILCLVCQSTTVQRHLVNLLTANQVRVRVNLVCQASLERI